MSVKTKKAEQKKLSKKLYNLLSDAEVISDGERMFWLENYSQLSAEAQDELVRLIAAGETELKHENEAHMNRMAEIDTKCLAHLQEFSKKHGLKASAGSGDGDDDQADFDADAIWQEVKQAEG